MTTSKTLLVHGLVLASLAGGLHAETLGFPSGRTANPNDSTGLSIEGVYVAGEYSDADYTNIGARISYSVLPLATVFVDYGFDTSYELDGASNLDPYEGNAVGGGLFYYFPDQTMLKSVDAAGKVSYHTADLDESRNGETSELNQTNIAIELLFSGKEALSASGVEWYANVGVQRIDIEFENVQLEGSTETEFSIGGGLVVPAGPGTFYVGVDRIDSISYGAGFRFNVK